MSRMILTLLSLVTLAGCQCCECPRYVSLAAARLETLGPNVSLLRPVNSDCCDDCVPHPTLKHKYEPWWDNFVTEHTAQRCAFRALCAYRKEYGGPISHHFKMGFISAYEDLAMNRKPVPPIMPPPMYWNAFYRSCAGRKYVDDWFAGYDAGLDIGSSSGVSRFHEIYLRRNRCNNGCAVGCDNEPVGVPNYGQPDPTGAFQDPQQSDGLGQPAYGRQEFSGNDPNRVPFQPMPPIGQGNPVPPQSVYGTTNRYGVSNFQGTPDIYGVQP